MTMRRLAAVLSGLALVAFAPAAAAAKGASGSCPAPGGDWKAMAPEKVGLNGAKLREAVDLAMRKRSQAVRIYRKGCRVAEDANAARQRDRRSESWSVAKSVTALIFGRAMTLGLISPDDPLGALIPEADPAHGEITMRHLLTQTSGLHWNGLRDYNILAPDRLGEALTVDVEKRPGSYWEYSQSGPFLLAESITRAVGEDIQEFAQRELFEPLGIDRADWTWTRDLRGRTQGYFGLKMSADDFARLGELLRRDGVWRGERLLSRRFVRKALKPVRQNGCYGWLIWLNASKPCVGPRVAGRPVMDHRRFPSLPPDVYQYAGMGGQWVTVFPRQEIVVVRTAPGLTGGSSAGGSLGGEAEWQEKMYRLVLEAVKDDVAPDPPPARDADSVSFDDVDRGFIAALAEPDVILRGSFPPPLPPAGPARARASLIGIRKTAVGADGEFRVRLRCPRAWTPALPPQCDGELWTSGTSSAETYVIPAGERRTLTLRLEPDARERLRSRGELSLTVKAQNRDAARGTRSKRKFTLRLKGAERGHKLGR